MCFDAFGSGLVVLCSRQEVPGYKGDERVDPNHRAKDVQEKRRNILLQLHPDGGVRETNNGWRERDSLQVRVCGSVCVCLVITSLAL